MSVAHKIEDKERTDDVHISERIDFTGLLLSPHVLEGLTKSGFKRPSPIQLEAIPLGRCGLDLIVQAKSGTGKTCVFTVIALEGLNLQTDALQVLILSPTREIAIQIREVITSIGSCMPELKCHSFIGGTSVQQDKISLRRCHIATGTPGRIKQLIELGMLKTQSIRLFVLDEADKLLGGDLTECINWIYSSLPDNKQILALSATYPEALAQHLTRYMRNPTFVRLNITDPALIGIKQYHVIVPDSPLPNKVFKAKTESVIKILSFVSFEQCLIFSNLQTRAQSLQSELQSRNWPTQCIAGCLDQKDRSLAMEHLKAYKCRILISTDLTSRGIDADKVNMVINLDVPLDHETYLHRIGRAGRFGSHGAAISIVSKGKQEKELWAVERKCKTNIPKLPDPIPSDLATRYVALKLSDVVTTEKIITHPELSLKPSQLSSDQQQFGNEEIGDADKEREVEENINADDNDRDTKSKENYENEDNVLTDEHGSGQMANTFETDLCNNSSPEFYSAYDEKSLGEDSSEIHSVGSWLDLCDEDEKNQVQFSKSIKDGYVAFSRHSELVSDRSSVVISELLHNLSPVKHSEDVSGSKSSTIQNNDGLHCESDGVLKNSEADVKKCVQCNEVLKGICSNKGENIAHYCSCGARERDKGQEIVSDDMKVSNGIHEPNKTDKPPNDILPVVESSVLLDSAVSYTLGDSIVDKTSQIHTEPRGVKSCSQTSHKPKKQKQKHPRPFALSAFLKGLSKTSNEVEDDDGTEDCGQPHVFDVTIEKEKDSAKMDFVESGKKDVTIEPGIDFVKGVKELELCPSSIDSGNLIQCIDLVISESPVVSGFHRNNSELCDVAEMANECCQMNEKSVSQDNKGIGESFDQKQIETSPVKETLTIRDSVLHKPDESLNNNKSKKEDSFVFPSGGGVPKRFSELQKDFKNFAINPRKVNMRDVCHSIRKQFSKMKLRPKVREKAHDFEIDGYSKLAEMKEDIKTIVEKTRLERIENPNTVKDFLNKAISSKSSEMHNEQSPVQQHLGRNKGGKRKKVNGRSSAAQNWRAKDNDNSDCRFKGTDNDDVGKVEGCSATRHTQNFDQLLREQLYLKGQTEERTDCEDKHDTRISGERRKCVNVGDGSKNEIIEQHRAPSKYKSDHFHGARPKTLNQSPSAIDRRNKSPTQLIVRGNPDKECQMLDKMHLEMLRKRKERKEQMAALKQNAQSSNGLLDIENTEPVTNCSININVDSMKDVAEMNSKSIKNKVEIASNSCRVSDETIPQNQEKKSVSDDDVPEQESVGKLKIQNDQGETSAKATLEVQDFDDLLREQLQLKGKNEKRIDNHGNERTKCISDGSESETVETTKPQAMSSKNELRIRPSGCRSKSESDRFNGARPKNLHQSPNARRHKSQLRVHGKPDKECQMLDKMNLEMLQKRKARKDLMVGLKRKASRSIGSVNIENMPTANSIKEPVIVCPVTKETTNRAGDSNVAGIIVNESVENKAESVSDGNKLLRETTLFTDKKQNLSLGNAVLEKLIVQNDKEKSSVERKLKFQDTDKHTSHYAPSESCAHNKIESTHSDKLHVRSKSTGSLVTKAHFKVLKFDVKGLDLSSDSDDLEVTLSSCTEVSDVNSSDLSFCEKSKKLRVVRKLKFAAESKGGRNRWNSPRSGIRFPTSHNIPTKSKSKKNLGKISVPVKNISSHDNVSNQGPNLQKHVGLNLSLSNNQTRSGHAFSSLNSPHHRPLATASSAISSSFLPPDREIEQIKVSENSNESNSLKYRKMKSKHQRKHQCNTLSEESSSMDEEIIDTFDMRSSSNNWWPYWLSLYHHYVRSCQWPDSLTSFHPYHYQQHHLHQQPPIGPYYHYHHLATHHLPPHHHYPHAMTDYANRYQYLNYTQAAASLQQKYIGHMARVMQKMSHRFVREQNERKRSGNG